MSNVKARVANPVAQTTAVQHTSGRPSAAPSSAGISNTTGSQNWSGVLASGVSGYFLTNASYVDISFQIPSVVLPQTDTTCQYGPYITSIWGGMDGWYQFAGGNDVLQAGVTEQATSIGSGCSASYYPWYEWFSQGCTTSNTSYPCYETGISNFAINPGDYMYIVITYYTTSPNGNAFISDQSTGQYASVAFSQPPPINSSNQYAGANAEWIVERPTYGGSPYYGGPADLVNYLGNAGPSGTELYLAADYSDNSVYGGAWAIGYGSESTITVLNMTCPPWNPSSMCSTWGPNLSTGTYYPPGGGGYYGVFTSPTGPVIHQ